MEATTERTAEQIYAVLATYGQARPQLARDVEEATRLMEEVRERLIRSAASRSVRLRTTGDRAAAAAAAAGEEVDQRLAELRSRLIATEIPEGQRIQFVRRSKRHRIDVVVRTFTGEWRSLCGREDRSETPLPGDPPWVDLPRRREICCGCRRRLDDCLRSKEWNAYLTL